MYYSNIPSNYSNFTPPNAIRTGQILIANRGLQHINCILPFQNNKGALFLGDVVCLLKNQLLEKHQIRSVLSCMMEPISIVQSNILNHKILPLRDNIEFPIWGYFAQASNFIHEARQKGHNVLVHCHAGVSRSAAIICAYLMLQYKWDLQRTLQFVRQKRHRAKPNASFIAQLQQFYHRQIRHHTVKANQTQPQTQNKHSQKRYAIINQKPKDFFITLDQQIQTHDELLQLQKRKLLKMQQLKQAKTLKNGRQGQNVSKVILGYDLPKQTDIGFKEVRQYPGKDVHSKHLEWSNNNQVNLVIDESNFSQAFHRIKSEIHFNKAYDPKLMKSAVQQVRMKQHTRTSFFPGNDIPNSNVNQVSMLSKSSYTPRISNPGYAAIKKTPTKQRNIILNNRAVQNDSKLELEANSYKSYGQKMNQNLSNNNTCSTMRNNTSYKQQY